VEQARDPAHSRTERIDFLEPIDGFINRFDDVHLADTPVVELGELPRGEGPMLVIPATP
jgi:hypothetical protein